MHIEPWPWVTVRSIKILEIIYIGIDKRSPLGTQFGGKTTNGQYFFLKITFFKICLHKSPCVTLTCNNIYPFKSVLASKPMQHVMIWG